MTVRVLDTNVLLDRPIEEIIQSFPPCKIILPLAVIHELDNFKGLEDQRGLYARSAIRFLDGLRPKLHQGVRLKTGHYFKVEVNHTDVQLPEILSKNMINNRILTVSKGIMEEEPLKLITQDIYTRLIADILGIPAENYIAESVELGNLYSGWCEVQISDREVQNFYQLNSFYTDYPLLANQYVKMVDQTGGAHYGRYNAGNKNIVSLCREQQAFGIGPAEENIEQHFLIDALLNPDIQLVSILGPAGTGKTLLALAAGLHQVINKGLYSKLVVSRALIPHGQDIGALPGDKEEKLSPWMGAIFDNLEFLLSNFAVNKYDRKSSPAEQVGKFMEEGYIELEALAYIRGRSIPGQWVIIDEAQNLTKENVKTIITRAGKGTKIVITGDIQQIDNCRLTATNNGFVTLIEAFKGQQLYAHITLNRTERSSLAALGVELL
ncbi:PhoH family protein [Pelotomaculum sp. PtaB.Bin117]|uniref:PhoH family protein n=1 Tax=Pelotomaculum sp. PtaB.Bin117 TaxID=1811694 RepID=UPI0009CDA9F4|nr:PhoH family protein [Pelotomaculum sp. PtaB.Bin117]OPX88954.1 MAG: PhoH-like protein [Pelotomaculum sp. PtaB.Bin117]OPY60390.1 MAG: PhoH-like protein [Pelotomaculum sp. PtaU1.Bin065]